MNQLEAGWLICISVLGCAQAVSCVVDELVEGGAVVVLAAVEELVVDVEGHGGLGVPDLALDVRDIEVGGEQHDRDIGSSQ
jgi:hypothetical protein